MKFLYFFFSYLVYTSKQTVNVDDNTLKFDEILNIAIGRPSETGELFTKIQEFVQIIPIVEADVKNFKTLSTALNGKIHKTKLKLCNVILLYLQNYLAQKPCLDAFNALYRSVSSPADPSNPVEGHTYATKMDALFVNLLISNPKFNDRDSLADKIRSRVPGVTDPQLDSIYTYYLLYKPYRELMESLNAFYDSVDGKTDVGVHEIEDKITQFETSFAIPSDKTPFIDFNAFKAHIETHDKDFATNEQKYREIHSYYIKYIYHKRSLTKREEFLNVVKKTDRQDSLAVKTAYDAYISTHEIIPQNIQTQAQFGNFLKIRDPSLTDQLVKIIYTFYLNHKIYQDRERKRNQVAIDNTKCTSKDYLEKLREFIEIYYEPPKVTDEANLLRVFSQIDPEFNNNHASKIFACYTFYYEVKERHEVKNKLKAKIKSDTIKIIDLKNEMDQFVDKYGLKKPFTNKLTLVLLQSQDPYFEDADFKKIERYYNDFVRFKQIETHREELLTKIKENPADIFETSFENSLSTFITEHFDVPLTDPLLPNYTFSTILKDNFNLKDEVINVLYLYYSNYKQKDIKLLKRNALLTALPSSTPKPIDFTSHATLMDDFIYIYDADFKKSFNQKEFEEHIKKQDRTSEDPWLFTIWSDYREYKNRISIFDRLYKKIQIHHNEFSLMTHEFDEFIRQFGLENIGTDLTVIENTIRKLYPSLDVSKLNIIKTKIGPYLQYKSRVEKRFKLVNFISNDPKATSTQIKKHFDHFESEYKLNNANIHNLKEFHDHLKLHDDGIELDDSKFLFVYYTKFKNMWNKQSIRDNLFNYLQQGNRFPANKLSLYYLMFVDAYGVGTTAFENENELKSFLEQQDDTVNDQHVEMIFEPLSIYLSYLERKSNEENLYYFIMFRSDHFGRDLSAYIKPYYDSYHLSYDIIFDKSVFESHINVLDGSIEQIKVNTIYPEIVKYSANIDRLNIINALYEFIKQYPIHSMSQIAPYLETFYHFFNFKNNDKIEKLENFVHEINRDIKEVSVDKIKIIHPHFIKFIAKKKFVIIRKLLVDYIEKNIKTTNSNIRPYMMPYLEKVGMKYSELSQYDIFAKKNKEMDDGVSKIHIDLIYEKVIIFIDSEEYTEIREVQKNEYNESNESQSNMAQTESGDFNTWSKIFKFFGIEPKTVENVDNQLDLTYYKQILADMYYYFTGIKLYRFPKKRIKKNLIH